jgi:hypothetical protein
MERTNMATAKWGIRSESEREAEAVEKWGKTEWNRRKAICEQKRDELEKTDSWEARIVIGNQFEPIMVMLDQEKFDVMATLPVWKWRRLVEKVIGV